MTFNKQQLIEEKMQYLASLPPGTRKTLLMHVEQSLNEAIQSAVESLRMGRRVMVNPVPESNEVTGYNEAVTALNKKIDELLK